jgi:hypothetical protein
MTGSYREHEHYESGRDERPPKKKPTQIHAAKDLRDAHDLGMNALLKSG